ncbi:YvrJ family protein [Evansella cellulosilytica]|uniref:YvrJ family protein n=1 Tax=Evansella cellulosilytica (strain ATCC 21833 / DSM 2522 / FERM P-1141 / JCM 9156 / N-4) TaxID=649639 RepID=E6TY24_EVAC2|nr:YvrJ family protein [Evansella cellulosilytica]ADU31237.1 hypothetical protein Bcell_2987 [Evansella cellulosilytica DSM 2522]
MDMWLSMLNEYGFPIIITFYLLHRIEKKLDKLNDSVLQLGNVRIGHNQYHHGTVHEKELGALQNSKTKTKQID